MKNFAIVVAAGNSVRFGGSIKKQFYKIHDKPTIFYSLNTFQNNSEIDSIVLVINKDDADQIKKIVDEYKFSKVSKIVYGGSTRQESVHNGLDALQNEGNVLIHDAARPLVDDEIIHELLVKLEDFDGAAPALKMVDTIVEVENEQLTAFADRDKLYRIQTPQAFHTQIIKQAHEELASLNATDDTQLLLTLGKRVAIIPGKEKLAKITRLEDTNAIKAYIEKDEHLQN